MAGNMSNNLQEIIGAIKRHIELEEMAGTGDWLDASVLKACPEGRTVSSMRRLSPVGSGDKGSEKGQISPLDKLKKEALFCTTCDLSETRTKVVFGSGSPKAKLMFVGEAPGMDEDHQGLPFVGRAGKLLTKIIESIGLKRSDVYIANILKCRPPNNRNPLPTEILACENYLIKQIDIIKPVVICALGKFAAQTLLRRQEAISKLRGRFFEYRNAKLIPTFHPAYLLRNPNDKRLVWEDMKKIRRELRGE